MNHVLEQCQDCHTIVSYCNYAETVKQGLCKRCASVRDIQLKCTLDRVRPFVLNVRSVGIEGTPIAISRGKDITIMSFGDICLMLDEIDRRAAERRTT